MPILVVWNLNITWRDPTQRLIVTNLHVSSTKFRDGSTRKTGTTGDIKQFPPLRLRQIHNNSKLELFRTNWSTIPIFEIVIDTIPTLKLWGFFGGALRAPYWNCFIWNCLRNLWEQFPILKLLQQQFPILKLSQQQFPILKLLQQQFQSLELFKKLVRTIPNIEIVFQSNNNNSNDWNLR